MRQTSRCLGVCVGTVALLQLGLTAPVNASDGLTVVKTVITETGVCPGVDPLDVPPSTNVKYCYQLTNNGPVTYSTHSLEDSVLGTISINPVPPLPGQTQMATSPSTLITQSITNVATWTAMTGSITDTVTDPATVFVCGNGIVESGGGEQCDKGTLNGTARACCDSNCQLVGGGDTDGDGICNSNDTPGNGANGAGSADPNGYFYNETSGFLVGGGHVTVTCISGCAPSNLSSLVVTETGETGRYSFVANFTSPTGVATFQLVPDAPVGCRLSTACLPQGSTLGPVASTPNPLQIGSGLNGAMTGLASFTCASNPFYLTMSLTGDSAVVIDNNIPVTCGPVPNKAPAMSAWGLTAASLALVAVGLYTLRRRQASMQ